MKRKLQNMGREDLSESIKLARFIMFGETDPVIEPVCFVCGTILEEWEEEMEMCEKCAKEDDRQEDYRHPDSII